MAVIQLLQVAMVYAELAAALYDWLVRGSIFDLDCRIVVHSAFGKRPEEQEEVSLLAQ